MMKKTRKLFVIFLSISLVLFSNFTSVFALTNVIEDNRAQDKIITSIEASTRNGTEISKNDSVCSIEYFTDPEGNLFDPADYCVDGESM